MGFALIFRSQHLQLVKYLIQLLLIFVLLPMVDAQKQSVEYEVEAYRTYGTIEIDGDLSEPEWRKVKPVDRFVQIEPYEGSPASQPMDVRILYDDSYIYFGFTCFDSDISKLVANEMRRDARDIHENDNVFILLDTYNDRRSGFFFRINSLGAMQDSKVINGGDSMNRDWDIVWECRTKINKNNWVLEVSIPFSQLRFEKQEHMVWGINLGREIARNKEEAIWSPVSKSYGGMAKYRTANLARLTGLTGIVPSRNLEISPYISPGLTKNDNDTNRVLDSGLDLKYGVTPNLTADFTYNTDFAQVEADQEEVNLTRFDLFFPEKRPFFLEGAGLFDFGIPRASFRRPPPLLLFYSRRIGIEEGNAIPITAGAKITGKTGPYGIGVLNVLTNEFSNPEDEIDIPSANYTVTRVKRDVLDQSSVGLIVVNKQESDRYNRSGGLDFLYRPNENLNVQGMWARTFDEKDMGSMETDASNQENAWSVGSRWRNDLFRLEGLYVDVGENFNPEVGFIRQQGIRRIRSEMRYTPWPRKFGVRRVWIGPEIDCILDQDNQLQTRDMTFLSWFEFESGGWVNFRTKHTLEHLEEEEEIRGIVIPAGKYSFSSFRTMIESDESKMISGRIGANFGGFWDGSRRGFDLGISFKPNGHLSFQSGYEFNQVELGAESFDASVLSARLSYSISTTLFAKVFTQWNNNDDIISTNFLLNYIYRPGSDFYFVFNQINENVGTSNSMSESTFIVKMTYWWHL